MLIDTHAHLTSDRFKNHTDEVIQRARDCGVEKIVSIACDLADSKDVVDLASRYDNVYPTVGIHPCYVHEVEEESWLEQIKELAEQNSVAAIGEVGLDFYHDPPIGFSESEWRSRQSDYFVKQISLANELDLPLVIHQRESGDEVLEILNDFPGTKAVLHCFTGTRAQAEKALSMGLYLSFTGVVTYPKAPEVREMAAFVPEDRFMVETDSPYLSPVPFRGKSNEPAFVTHTAKKIADVRNISEQECAEISTENAHNFFHNLRNG
ncbi:MAG: TatD family hydrolase [Verrucomicrobiales bacterium]|nr:TatD family hydrolase [Verrucomicrobiales bacterium]